MCQKPLVERLVKLETELGLLRGFIIKLFGPNYEEYCQLQELKSSDLLDNEDKRLSTAELPDDSDQQQTTTTTVLVNPFLEEGDENNDDDGNEIDDLNDGDPLPMTVNNDNTNFITGDNNDEDEFQNSGFGYFEEEDVEVFETIDQKDVKILTILDQDKKSDEESTDNVNNGMEEVSPKKKSPIKKRLRSRKRKLTGSDSDSDFQIVNEDETSSDESDMEWTPNSSRTTQQQNSSSRRSRSSSSKLLKKPHPPPGLLPIDHKQPRPTILDLPPIINGVYFRLVTLNCDKDNRYVVSVIGKCAVCKILVKENGKDSGGFTDHMKKSHPRLHRHYTLNKSKIDAITNLMRKSIVNHKSTTLNEEALTISKHLVQLCGVKFSKGEVLEVV